VKDAFLKITGLLTNTSLDTPVRQSNEHSSDLKVSEVNRERRNAIVEKDISYHRRVQPLEYTGPV